MYCIYYNKDYDTAIIVDGVDNNLKLLLYDIRTLQEKIRKKEINIVNLKSEHFEKEDLSPSMIKAPRIYTIFPKVSLDREFPLALKINTNKNYIVLELVNNDLVISVCDLEFIRDCIDVETYSSISLSKLQERGLRNNDNKDRDSRRKEYSYLQTIQVGDYRREASIRVHVQQVKKRGTEESTDTELETEVGTDTKPDNIQIVEDKSTQGETQVVEDKSLNEEVEKKDSTKVETPVEETKSINEGADREDGNKVENKDSTKVETPVEETKSINEGADREDGNKVENNGTSVEEDKGINSKSENEIETEENTKVETISTPINKGVQLDFGDEPDDEIIDDFTPTYSEYDPNCSICHGSGRVKDKGFLKECSCGAKIKKLRERNKIDNQPIFKITNAVKENVVSYGLIPEEYRDIEYDEKVMYSILSQRYRGKKVKVQNYSSFVNTLSAILASCRTGQKLRHSYIIYGDKGFGKKTFVYTCLKYLYARNVPILCKYTSLSELGLLKAEAIKRASAINNLGYYTRDTDRELIQKSLVEESRRAVTALLNEWFNLVKEESGLKTAFRTFKYKVDQDIPLDEQNDEIRDRKLVLGKKFEDAIIRNAYERMAEEERIINYGEEYCGRLVNTWEDYINAPIVFVFFSGIGERRFETEVLQTLLNIRGAKALPTVAITETALITAQDEHTMFAEDNSGRISSDSFKAKSYFWNSMLSDACDIDIRKIDKNKLKDEISNNIEYDRMLYIYSYAKYQDKLKVGIDI